MIDGISISFNQMIQLKVSKELEKLTNEKAYKNARNIFTLYIHY